MGNKSSINSDDYSINLEDNFNATIKGNLVIKIEKPMELLFLDPTSPDGQEVV